MSTEISLFLSLPPPPSPSLLCDYFLTYYLGVHKTPSKGSKTPKKTPKAADRFIPNRTTTQFDVSHFKLMQEAKGENEPQEMMSPSQVEYQRVMSENLNGDRLSHRIISYKEKAPSAPEGMRPFFYCCSCLPLLSQKGVFPVRNQVYFPSRMPAMLECTNQLNRSLMLCSYRVSV